MSPSVICWNLELLRVRLSHLSDKDADLITAAINCIQQLNEQLAEAKARIEVRQ